MELPSTPVSMGNRVELYKLSRAFYSDVYLGWLNDAEVQRYTRRRGRVTTEASAKEFLTYVETSTDVHFAILLREGKKHIGNVSLNTVDLQNKSAELSIMIGDRAAWGQGYASEVIELATTYGFQVLKLHRLWAESPNPAFHKTMQKLGWTQEGVRRDAMLIDGVYHDMVCWSLLQPECTSA